MIVKRLFILALSCALISLGACSKERNSLFEPQVEAEGYAHDNNATTETSGSGVPTILYVLDFFWPWAGFVQSYSEDGFLFESEGNMLLTGKSVVLLKNTGRLTCTRLDGEPFRLHSFVMTTRGRLTVTSGTKVRHIRTGASTQVFFEGSDWSNITSFELEVLPEDQVEGVGLDDFYLSTGGVLLP